MVVSTGSGKGSIVKSIVDSIKENRSRWGEKRELQVHSCNPWREQGKKRNSSLESQLVVAGPYIWRDASQVSTMRGPLNFFYLTFPCATLLAKERNQVQRLDSRMTGITGRATMTSGHREPATSSPRSKLSLARGL